MTSANEGSLQIQTRTLEDWQQSLEHHFLNLSKTRKDKNIPVFALEHGLSSDVLQNIFLQLRKGWPSHSHWLLWVIYATELGYEYDGDEYWQSFEGQTPFWDFSQRDFLRGAFREFQQKYSGVKPSGTWAKHFSIISRPITHAILPRDLQYHFAKMLYQARYKITSSAYMDAENIGRILRANSFYIYSSRFQNFLQQEELVGRIALAMIDHHSENSSSDLIYIPTLRRIVSDLEEKRNAREWIKIARQDIKARILGASSSNFLSGNDNRGQSSSNFTSRQTSFLKPKLSLQRIGPNKWVPIVEIPSFSEALENLELLNFLKKTRVSISGVKGTWLLGESLLYGALRRRLAEWPSTSEPIIKLEKENGYLNHLINSECRITGPTWLFRVGQDGMAGEIVGKIIRPGFEYILVSQDQSLFSDKSFKSCEIQCEGVTSISINVPHKIEECDLKAFKDLGLAVCKTIQVWPAGLPARSWDGEGTSEWLTTETPCFGISHDHPLEEYTITLGGLTLDIKAKAPGTPTFIKLPSLPAGRYVLTVRPKTTAHLDIPQLEGFILLEVREPVSWTPGSMLHQGLRVILDPVNDNLDDFLEGETELKIFGPKDYAISVHLEFHSTNELLGTVGIENLDLPLDSKKIKNLCQSALNKENLQAANRADVVISGESLGRSVINLQREVTPLRWFYKSENNKPFLRLIDDTDNSDTLELSFFPFEKPAEEKKLEPTEWMKSKSVENIKGLVCARKTGHQQLIIIDHLESATSFQALGVSPQITGLSDNPEEAIHRILDLLDKWNKARSINFISSIHCRTVLEAFAFHLFSYLCGYEWADLEKAFAQNDDYEAAINRLSSGVRDRSFVNITRNHVNSINLEAIAPESEAEWFADRADRCGICKDITLSRFALLLASSPLQMIERSDLKEKIQKLGPHKNLIRGARLLALGISKRIEPQKTDSLIQPAGWKW